MKHFFPKKLNFTRLLLLTYFILLTVLGLPLALVALKLNLDYRRQAETVTVRATIPPNPFNTPQYKELYNKKVIIEHMLEVDLITGRYVAIPITLTDPDWVPGLKTLQTRFSSTKPLPPGFSISCTAHKKTKKCTLTGTPMHVESEPQLLTIRATDALGATSTSKVLLR